MQTARASLRGDPLAESLAAQVEAWGYPRKISEREVVDGAWFTNGRAIVWFIAPGLERLPPLPARVYDLFDGALCVHGIADPGQRGQALTCETEQLLCEIGASLGARKLYSLIPHETPNMPVRAMRRYLRRFGWVEDEFGSYKLLGGA